MHQLLGAIAGGRPMSKIKEHIEKAKQHKNDGNEFYRKLLEEYKKPVDQRDTKLLEKLQKDAKRHYHYARFELLSAYPFNKEKLTELSDHVREGDELNDENAKLVKEREELLASIFNNLAATILAYPEGQKESDFERASEFCSNVLCFQKNNTKAMYRKAQALEKLGHQRRALTWLREADLIENHQNAAIRRDFLRLQKQLEEGKKKANNTLKENFQRGLSKGGLGLSTDATEYGKREKKKGRRRYDESPSRDYSSSSSESSDKDL